MQYPSTGTTIHKNQKHNKKGYTKIENEEKYLNNRTLNKTVLFSFPSGEEA